MNPVADFHRSRLIFVLDGQFTSLTLDATCRCEDTAMGAVEVFGLLTPCQGEKMFVERGLVQDPPFHFAGVWSEKSAWCYREFADASVRRDTYEELPGRFERVRLEIVPWREAKELPDYEAIAAATFARLPLAARTEIESPDGRFRFAVDYPVKIMNVKEGIQGWQVDTGPILFPRFPAHAARMAESLAPAFIVYNRPDYAEITVRQAVTLPAGDRTYHFAGPQGVRVSSRLFASLSR